MTARILLLGGGFPGLYAARELRRRRVASARAAEDTRVLVMERDEFVRLAAALPAFRSYFQHHMAEQGLDFPLDEERSRSAAE